MSASLECVACALRVPLGGSWWMALLLLLLLLLLGTGCSAVGSVTSAPPSSAPALAAPGATFLGAAGMPVLLALPSNADSAAAAVAAAEPAALALAAAATLGAPSPMPLILAARMGSCSLSAAWQQGCVSSCAAVTRAVGEGCRQALITACRSALLRDAARVAGYLPSRTSCQAGPSVGSSTSHASSATVRPREKMSAAGEVMPAPPSLDSSSGAMYLQSPSPPSLDSDRWVVLAVGCWWLLLLLLLLLAEPLPSLRVEVL